MENKELEAQLKVKLLHLTFPGAREFWNEIVEDLDSQIRLCERGVKDFTLSDLEIRKAQIQIFVCERLKELPERLVKSINDQLAEKPSGDTKEDLAEVNFLKPPTEALNGGK